MQDGKTYRRWQTHTPKRGVKQQGTGLTITNTITLILASTLTPQSARADEVTPVIIVTASNLDTAMKELDHARDQNLAPKLGATSYVIDHKMIDAMPQGADTPVDKLVLQAPGVSADTAISNPSFHVRNEYANVQYDRIDGIELPDGVSALGPVLQANFIGKMDLLDGVMPAQYGLRTAGVLDITTQNAFATGGLAEISGGSQSTFNPSAQMSGHDGQTEYFVSGSYLQSDEGLESATPNIDPIHDKTKQGRFFGYGSTMLNDTSRLTYMAGGFVGQFQIPDVMGASPLGNYGPASLLSTNINENERDAFLFALIALQTHTNNIDTQFSLYAREATTHFMPDTIYDLAFNNVATDVTRQSMANGAQFDSALKLNHAHTLRAGLVLNVEETQMTNLASVLPLDNTGNILPTPAEVNESIGRTGWTLGAYLQDEWRLSPILTLNTGVRFDAMRQFVSAHQLSPRIALIATPSKATSLHLGMARYFTPPMQAQASPNPLALYNNTTQQQVINADDPVKPERATYFDAGIDQKLLSRIDLGLDAYIKTSRDTLDDGQFGQAVVLDQYNWAHGFSHGVEMKASYTTHNLHVYGNFSVEVTKAEDVVSNQYIIGDPVQLTYMATHDVYASDAQTYTASWGGSYNWHGFLGSLDGIYGSGLRAGFANEQHSPAYTQWNAAIARTITPWRNGKALSIRLSAINLLDHVYILRSGTGIGEYAPQYGPRRQFILSLTQSL